MGFAWDTSNLRIKQTYIWASCDFLQSNCGKTRYLWLKYNRPTMRAMFGGLPSNYITIIYSHIEGSPIVRQTQIYVHLY